MLDAPPFMLRSVGPAEEKREGSSDGAAPGRPQTGAAAPGALDSPCKVWGLGQHEEPQQQPGHHPTTPRRRETSESSRRQKSHLAACPVCAAKGQCVAALCQELNVCRRVPATKITCQVLVFPLCMVTSQPAHFPASLLGRYLVSVPAQALWGRAVGWDGDVPVPCCHMPPWPQRGDVLSLGRTFWGRLNGPTGHVSVV